MRKWILSALVICLGLAVALVYNFEEMKPIKKKKLTFNIQTGSLPTLHPHHALPIAQRCLSLALYEPLMRRDPDGKLEPAAAERVEIDPTQTIYTFYIRPHHWSNNEKVTSFNFANSWRWALDRNSTCVKADLFYAIKNGKGCKEGALATEAVGISTPDERTLIVTLEAPTPYFLDLTATPFFAPIYDPSDREPVYFNGPFTVDTLIHEQQLILSRNPLYWDVKAVSLEEICCTMIKDPNTAFKMYENGELDLIGDPYSPIPIDAMPTLMESGLLHIKPISRAFYLFLNVQAPCFHNKLLRQALSLCLDRALIAKDVFFGQLPTYSPLPRTLSLITDQMLKEYADPVDLFERALAELHLTRENFPKITLSYTFIGEQKRLAEYVQAQWKEKLGIDVLLEGRDLKMHLSDLQQRKFQVGALNILSMYPDPMFYLDYFRDGTSKLNYSGWEHHSFQALLDKSASTLNKGERHAFLEQAERLLFEEMPVIPLLTHQAHFLAREGVNLVISDIGLYDFKHTSVH